MSAALNASLKQAIVAARGDKADAARRLVALAKHDPAVMLALVEPYLQGIAFDAVNKVMARAAAKGPAPAAGPAAPGRTRAPSAPAHILASAVETLPPPTVTASPKAEVEPERRPPVPKPAPAPKAAPPRRVLKPGEVPSETLDAIFDQIGKTLPPVKRSVRQPKTPEEAVMQGIGRDPNGPPPPVAGARHQKAILAMAQSFKKR